jgi:hypothetical protein
VVIAQAKDKKPFCLTTKHYVPQEGSYIMVENCGSNEYDFAKDTLSKLERSEYTQGYHKWVMDDNGFIRMGIQTDMCLYAPHLNVLTGERVDSAWQYATLKRCPASNSTASGFKFKFSAGQISIVDPDAKTEQCLMTRADHSSWDYVFVDNCEGESLWGGETDVKFIPPARDTPPFNVRVWELKEDQQFYATKRAALQLQVDPKTMDGTVVERATDSELGELPDRPSTCRMKEVGESFCGTDDEEDAVIKINGVKDIFGHESAAESDCCENPDCVGFTQDDHEIEIGSHYTLLRRIAPKSAAFAYRVSCYTVIRT